MQRARGRRTDFPVGRRQGAGTRTGASADMTDPDRTGPDRIEMPKRRSNISY